MATRQHEIRQPIDTSFGGFGNLETLAEALKDTNPQLLRNAAAEFDSVREKLKNLYDTLERELPNLERDWSQGGDATQVREQLTKLKTSTYEVMEAIKPPELPPNVPVYRPGGISAALRSYAMVLEYARGDNVPDAVTDDTSALESGAQGAAVGAAAGAFIGSFFAGVGAVPGSVIGGLIGGVVGGVGAILGDIGINLWGESKEEANLRMAQEHLQNMTNAAAVANDNFPLSYTTDIPMFDINPPTFDPTLPPGGRMPDVSPLNNINMPFKPVGLDDRGGLDADGLDGLNPNGIGDLNGLNPDGLNPDGLNPDGLNPDGLGTGLGTDGLGGLDPNGLGDLNGPGTDGLPATTLPVIDGNGPGTGNLDTSLAAFNPNGLNGLNNNYGTVLGGNGLHGPNGLYGPNGGGSNGIGLGAAGAGLGAGARGLGAGMNGTMPMAPLAGRGGRKGEEEERERTTWLLEDDEVFTSDEPVTSHRIEHATPKIKRGRS
ncbi:WXG100 family type VII secretion target [Thermostaphylospora chromogena]|uniref:WXG100 family type VII secretion target n=1 Tax=Thermostaphylospora chromogena TaxID=35622 RepID=A0A1H1AUK8_9ACTN|nr:hypothetical protein [Thermostaphylospora chromogena]SDQ42816.1 hypothetical protein SAMN04489764_0641 [Thermostaphylospora chromogena]